MSDTATTIRDLIGLGMPPALASYLVLTPKAETFSVLDGSVTPASINGLDAAQGGRIDIIGGTSSTAGNAGGAVIVKGGVPGETGAGGAVTIGGAAGGSTSGSGGATTVTTGRRPTREASTPSTSPPPAPWTVMSCWSSSRTRAS